MQNKKFIIGALIIVGIAFSWVISTQISQRIQTTDSFSCPFFMIWFSTSWILLCLIPAILKKAQINEALKEIHLSKKKLFLHSIVFYILWIIANYLYVFALNFMSASDVTAIFSSANAFVFIFSIFLLKEKINFLKISSVMFSISGIILIALANTAFKGSAKGVIFTLISAVSAALYKVLLKKVLGDPALIITNLFLGFLAIVNICLAWPIIVILTQTEVEILIYENIPWGFLVLAALASFFFNILINFGIAYTYPLFISIGTIVGIPLNIVVDVIINELSVDWKEILGACLIIFGFICLLINNYFAFRNKKDNSLMKSHLLDKEEKGEIKEKCPKTEVDSNNDS